MARPEASGGRAAKRPRLHDPAGQAAETLDAAGLGCRLAAHARQEDFAEHRPAERDAGETSSSSSSCTGSCARGDLEAEAPACSGCSRVRELEAELHERQALVEALHSKNCMLAILNSNLLMRLDALRSLALAPAAPPASLHLRISLPGEYAAAADCARAGQGPGCGAAALAEPGGDGGADATHPAPPMLHIWVNGDVAVSAVRASMHSFVAAPAGQSWVLSRARGGCPLGDQESPQSLHLAEGDLLFAKLDGGQAAGA